MDKMPIVSDFMDHEFVKFTPDMSVATAIESLLKHAMTGAVVTNNQNELVGVLSEKECLQKITQDAYHRTPEGSVADYMQTDGIQTIAPDTDIIEASQAFVKNTFRRMPVVQDGKVVGQITRRDILRGMQDFYQQRN